MAGDAFCPPWHFLILSPASLSSPCFRRVAPPVLRGPRCCRAHHGKTCCLSLTLLRMNSTFNAPRCLPNERTLDALRRNALPPYAYAGAQNRTDVVGRQTPAGALPPRSPHHTSHHCPPPATAHHLPAVVLDGSTYLTNALLRTWLPAWAGPHTPSHTPSFPRPPPCIPTLL